METSILQRIAAGEEDAVTACMDEYGGLVWSIARRFSESVADAEDATQEVFLQIWKSADRYDPAKGSESVFIATIARRRLIDRIRARKRRPQTEEFDEQLQSQSGHSLAAEGSVAAEAAIAERALQTLEPGQREVLLMSIVHGMTHSEIATATGRPLGTIKTQSRRGLARVRAILEEPGPADEQAR